MLNITSGGMSGGYRSYLLKMVPRLAAHPQVEALLVGMPESLDFSELRNAVPRAEWLPLKSSLLTIAREMDGTARKAVERFSPDVLFIPTARHWSFDGVPVVNMVQNMKPMMLGYTTYRMERVRNWVRFRQMRKAVERSNRVVAISRFVKDYLTDEIGVPETKVGVVYHGTELNGRHVGEKPACIPDDWSGRFVFTAGLIYPYRGLEDLIEAWQLLRDVPGLPVLAIAGKVGKGMSRYYDTLKRLLLKNKLDSHIRFLGVLTPDEMTWCYRNCTAFMMTSRVEACPNIALEAMANGALCISTENPPLPEVFQDAALYYPAGQAERLAGQIRNILSLPAEERQRMRNRASARAACFSWESCADQTVAELRKVIRR
jgi:glycosyltransferase involved in cell wall biosynthesis